MPPSSEGTGPTIAEPTFRASGIRFPLGITTGADGALWFTNYTMPGSIGRITTAGVVTSYASPNISYSAEITSGPDGALWFVNEGSGNRDYWIGRITTTGTATKSSWLP